MVITRSQACRDQDFVNSKLRPNKLRFPRGTIPGAKQKMLRYGEKHLRNYRPQIDYRYSFTNFKMNILRSRYHTYYNFDLERNVPNYQIPRTGRTVRITGPTGEALVLGRKRIRSGQFRVQYEKMSFQEQLEESFRLYDQSLSLLEQV